MTEAVRAQAVRLLARREHSRVELARKLEAKGHGSDVAKRVVSELACQGLQSDRRFTDAFVRSRIGRGQGERKIRADLHSRGIDDTTADPFMADVPWIEIATEALHKRFSEPPADRNEWARRARFLAGRGFPSDIVATAIGNAPR
ncbi:MAG: regulatory protein RecX [Gammaproteobacteria bacterium]|nr:regulatory protein RecX [Gammaproteobacteria bacterium]